MFALDGLIFANNSGRCFTATGNRLTDTFTG